MWGPRFSRWFFDNNLEISGSNMADSEVLYLADTLFGTLVWALVVNLTVYVIYQHGLS